jgi:hypothetical protein
MAGRLSLLTILLLLLSASSCGWLPLGGGWIESWEMDYFLEGGDIANFSGAQAADSAVVQLAREVMAGRQYYMGLYRHGGASSAENYRIQSGDAACRLDDPGYMYLPYTPNGTVEVAGQALNFTFVLPATDTRAELRLSGTCPLKAAQQAINEVRRPKWQDNTSVSTAEATWTLSGTYGGSSFSVSFAQTLTGRSMAWSQPI